MRPPAAFENAGDAVQKRRLAGPAWPHQSDDVTGMDFQAHVDQGVDPCRPLPEMLGEVLDTYDQPRARLRHGLSRTRHRLGRVDPQRNPNTEGAGGEADRHRDDEHDGDALEIQNEPSRKVGLEGEYDASPIK